MTSCGGQGENHYYGVYAEVKNGWVWTMSTLFTFKHLWWITFCCFFFHSLLVRHLGIRLCFNRNGAVSFINTQIDSSSGLCFLESLKVPDCAVCSSVRLCPCPCSSQGNFNSSCNAVFKAGSDYWKVERFLTIKPTQQRKKKIIQTGEKQQVKPQTEGNTEWLQPSSVSFNGSALLTQDLRKHVTKVDILYVSCQSNRSLIGIIWKPLLIPWHCGCCIKR